ncbi:MAG TPA: hypothetical protein V6C76_03195 [Drouetiella sp.]
MNKDLSFSIQSLLCLLCINASGTAVGAQPSNVGKIHARPISVAEQQRLNLILVNLITTDARAAWTKCHVRPTGKVLTTKTSLTLDSFGRITQFKIVSPSGYPPEDEAVKKVVTTLKFPALPTTIPAIKLFWTFMSDGSMNMLDNSQSAEADAYNKEHLGRVMGPSLGDIDSISH